MRNILYTLHVQTDQVIEANLENFKTNSYLLHYSGEVLAISPFITYEIKANTSLSVANTSAGRSNDSNLKVNNPSNMSHLIVRIPMIAVERRGEPELSTSYYLLLGSF